MKKIKNYKYKITENDIKKQVKQYLTLMEWFHFHILQGLGAFIGIPENIWVEGIKHKWRMTILSMGGGHKIGDCILYDNQKYKVLGISYPEKGALSSKYMMK